MYAVEYRWPLRRALQTWMRHRDARRTAAADELSGVLIQAQATVLAGHFTSKDQVEKANTLLSNLAERITRLRRPELAGERETISKGQATWLAAGTSMATIRRHYRIDGED